MSLFTYPDFHWIVQKSHLPLIYMLWSIIYYKIIKQYLEKKFDIYELIRDIKPLPSKRQLNELHLSLFFYAILSSYIAASFFLYQKGPKHYSDCLIIFFLLSFIVSEIGRYDFFQGIEYKKRMYQLGLENAKSKQL